MKKVYFIRHGESEGNVGSVRQGSDSPLSKLGIKQSQLVARRLQKINFDRLVSSPQERARQTAEIIGNHLNLEAEYSELFAERRRPSCVFGQPKDSPAMVEIEEKIRNNFHILDWHHSDEENFSDLKTRAERAIEYIENIPKDRLLVITSGIILRMIACSIIHKKDLTSKVFLDFYLATYCQNTGITIFEKFVWRNENPKWRMVTWNDYSHLMSQ